MKYLNLFLFMLIGFFSFGQDQYLQVISCKGEVIHQLAATESIVVPGSKIKAEGNLVLKKGSMIKLISKDRPQKLNSEGVYDLKEIYAAGEGKSMSFTGKFWKYMMDGLNGTDSKASIESYGDQSAAGGIKGFNLGAQGDIELISPIYGKINDSTLEYEWRALNEKTARLTIYNRKGDLVYEGESNIGKLTVDVDKVGLSPGTYRWQVSQAELASNRIEFEYAPVDSTRLENKLNRISDYVEGDDLEKQWIETVVLEMDGYTFNAGQKYRRLMEENPQHLLFKKLYVLHLTKMGQTAEAIAIKEAK